MKRIRVMIVEDSETVRCLLTHIIDSDPRLQVVASASSAEEALRLLPRTFPDVISMDIRLPGMNGFEATSAIMSSHPTPVVVVSASVNAEDLNITMNALRAGALTVVEKPHGSLSADYAGVAHHLCQQLVSMSQVKVVRQRIQRPKDFPCSTPSALPPAHTGAASQRIRMLGIAASTGGPAALLRLFSALPADFPVPILLVQHMAPAFLDGFVDWLRRCVPQKVVQTSTGQIPQGGHIYLAPADRHLEVGPSTLRVTDGPPLKSQRPSATVLFETLARHYGSTAIGVLLTGMGEDGAQGLLQMRQAGGHTIAEDASTAVVFGMPAAAKALDAATEMLALTKIAPRLCELTLGQLPR